MAVTTYSFFNWNSVYSYSRWDVIYGTTAADTRYFYSTKDGNAAANPDSFFSYSAVGGTGTRDTNVMRLTFTQTGMLHFQPGSIVIVSGVNGNNVNYTGTILAAGTGAAPNSSWYIDYLNPGRNEAIENTQGRVFAPIHPYWGTGFAWIPSFATDISHDQQIVRTQLGDGYSSRFNPVINSNSLSWNLQFEERTDKETIALLNFLQNFGGANPFVINFPIGGLYNKPGVKYISGPVKHQLASHGLNNISVPVTQVFDI